MINKYFIILLILLLPAVANAAELEALKVDLLTGNYRRVIFEGNSQLQGVHLKNNDELTYILGLSYLKESKLAEAAVCFKRILNSSSSKFKSQAHLALADVYLVSGQFAPAEDIYQQLLSDGSSVKLKPAILFRLSQLEAKIGDRQKSNDYWLKLKRDFPLAAETKAGKILILPVTPIVHSNPVGGVSYSVQLGFFSSSSNAQNFQNALIHKNYAAYIEHTGSGYRVKVGRFATEQEALDLAQKLSRDGFSTKVCP